eukprot:jgi/Hompol1/3362/HPOL_006489-RA
MHSSLTTSIAFHSNALLCSAPASSKSIPEHPWSLSYKRFVACLEAVLDDTYPFLNGSHPQPLEELAAQRSQVLWSVPDLVQAFYQETSQSKEPADIIPSLLSQVLLAWFSNTSGSQEHPQLCYDARLRAALREVSYLLTEALVDNDSPINISKLAQVHMANTERMVTQDLPGFFAIADGTAPSLEAQQQQQQLTDENAIDRNPPKDRGKRWQKLKRWSGIGAATIAGGVVVGVTGGLAAPMVAAGLGTLFTGMGLITASAAAATASTATGAMVVGTFFGVTGGGLAGKLLSSYHFFLY